MQTSEHKTRVQTNSHNFVKKNKRATLKYKVKQQNQTYQADDCRPTHKDFIKPRFADWSK